MLDQNLTTVPTPDYVQLAREACAFRQRLAASEQLTVLAVLLMRTHYLYEGWGEPPTPAPDHLVRWYRTRAEWMLRRCDDSTQAVAREMAGNLAVKQWDAVTADVTLAADDDQADQIIRHFAGNILDTYEHHARAMPGRSTAEILQFRAEGIEDGQS